MKSEHIQTLQRLIDEAKRRHGAESDAQLARALGVNPMTISRIKEGEIGSSARAIAMMLASVEEQVTA